MVISIIGANEASLMRKRNGRKNKLNQGHKTPVQDKSMAAHMEYDNISGRRTKRKSVRWQHHDMSTCQDTRTQRHVLDIKEDLAEVDPNRSK
jgi:hypothetical protein